MILSNALSKSFGSLDASTSRAMSRKRLCRSASVSLGLRSGLRRCSAMPRDIARTISGGKRRSSDRAGQPIIALPRDLFFQHTADRNDLSGRIAPRCAITLQHDAHLSRVFSYSFKFPKSQNREDHERDKCCISHFPPLSSDRFTHCITAALICEQANRLSQC
jgi:hypothetical protein